MANFGDEDNIDNKAFSFLDLTGRGKWTVYTPTWTTTDVGGAGTRTARYLKVGNVCFFEAKIVPATSVAFTAGTSNLTLPLTARGLSGVATVANLTTLVATGVAVIDVANSKCILPTLVATANTILIAGWYEV